jgi:putative copper export protein
MRISKVKIFFLVVSFISLYLVDFDIYAHAQVETTIDNTATSEAVTSINDAILKSLIIISQVAVLGIIFNYFFFNRFLIKKRGNSISNTSQIDIVYSNVRTQKRVISISIICCISIIIFSTGSMLLQSYQLAQNLEMDILSAFDILDTTSVGQVWILRVVTSSAIIAMLLISYAIYKKRKSTSQMNIMNLDRNTVNKISFTKNIPNQILLLIIIALSSINLFSNSMVSHSNSLPLMSPFAVSVDLIHFMAVSVWIGGLFYLSLILIKNLKPIDSYNDKSDSTNTVSNSTVSDNMVSVHNISIALMYFSFIVIIALCIIGITGLYLGYAHLLNLNNVFNTQYGQILVLKLALAFPLIFIGRYNQLKIHKYTSLISASIKEVKNPKVNNILQGYQKDMANIYIALDKSLKIESLLGISVLIVAAFLSVTSPPSLEALDQGSINIQDNSLGNTSNSFFLYLIMTLAVIIAIIGVVNFRKNQKQINSIVTHINTN